MNTSTFPSLADPSLSALKMSFPSKQKHLPKSGIVLAADLGGTKTELALFEIKNNQLVWIKNGRYPTSSHDSFVAVIKGFHNDDNMKIDTACISVAGNIQHNKVHGTNFGWNIDGEKIGNDLEIKNLFLINDLQANAYGLSALQNSDFLSIYQGEELQGNAAIISPGTGLGEAGLFWDGNSYQPFATEGGHCNFSPTDKLDVDLWTFLHEKFDHASWERVISGQGIENIYDFLRMYRNISEPKWLSEDIEKKDKAAAISSAAAIQKETVCVECIQLFFKYLAIEASQLALKTKANGGIFIGGGIVPKILDLLDKEKFIENFLRVGRLQPLLKTIPIKVVLNDKTALMGAAYYAAMEMKPLR